MHPVRTRIALPLLLLLLVCPARASEPEFVTEDSDVLLEIDGESRLEIVGLIGTLALRHGTEGELRYAARSLNNRRSEMPVELWLEGRTLLLVPIEGREEEPVLIEIGVPPGLAVLIDTADSRVTASNLQTSLELRGHGLSILTGAVTGSIVLELQGGSVSIKNAGDNVEVKGKELELDIQGVEGRVDLVLEKSTAKLSYTGEIEGELQETELVATSVDGSVTLDQTAGKLELEDVTEGGELRLSGADVSLKTTDGTLRVHTDANVIFHDHVGELRINGYGTSVRGSKLEGMIDVETDSGDVILDSIDGQVNLRGREMNVQLTDARGPVEITGSYSTILVDRAKSTVRVRNDFGEMEIREALQTVAVNSVEDEIRITGLRGALQLDAEGSEVDVTWAAIPAEIPSMIENDRGDVRLTLPTSGDCQIHADAPYGRVESSIPGLKVSEDGHTASGLLSRARSASAVKRAVLRVRAGGDIVLTTARAQARSQGTVPAPRPQSERPERRRP